MSVLVQNIIEIANVVIEIILIFLYFSLLSKQKPQKIISFSIFLLAAMLLSFVVLYSENIFINLITTIFLTTLISFTCFEDTIKNRILEILIYLMIISVAEPIVIGILCVANIGTPNNFLQSGLGRYLGMIGTDLIYLWFIGMMHRIINKKLRNLPVRYWILIIVIPIISIFLLQTILDSFNAYSSINYWSLGISLLGIMYINIAMFNFFESYEDKIKLNYLETLKQHEEENYKLLTLSHKQLREFKHDIENQFSVLNDMLEKDNIDSAKEYLEKLSSFVRLANRLCYTGNNAVDSIVNIKGSLAKNYGIEFICKINIITSIKADELELCRIIGNGLDNAIEGCRRSDAPEKHICLSISEEREKIFLVITNTSNEVNTSALYSTKKEKGLHGIGMNSIKSSVERLNGFMKYNYCDGIFELNIMIQNRLYF